MKIKILTIFFLISTIILFIPIIQNNSYDLFRTADFGLQILVSGWFVIIFMIAVSCIPQKRYYDSLLYFMISFTLPILLAKISFDHYNFYFHLIYLIIFSLLLIIIKNQNVNKFLLRTSLIINVFAILVSHYFIFQMLHSKNIAWSNNFLKWEMFKDRREKYLDSKFSTISIANDYEIYCELGKDIPGIVKTQIRYKINQFDRKPSVIAMAFFIPSQSFYSEQYKTKEQLKYYQLSADICELYTRKIRAIFMKKELASIDFEKEFSRYNIDYDETQIPEMKARELIESIIKMKEFKNYDLLFETKNGRNTLEVKRWEREIKKDLLSLEKYRI